MQDVYEVTVTLSVGKEVSKKSVELVVHPSRLELSIDGQSHLSGTLEREVDVDGSYWFMDDTKETEESKCLTVVLLKKVMGYESFAHLLQEDVLDTTVTTSVCAMIQIDGEDAGVLVFGLFGRSVPEAVGNFVSLANGRNAKEKREEMTGSVFKNVYPGQYVEFGLPKGAVKEDDPLTLESLRAAVKGLKHESAGLLSIDPEGGLTDFTLTFKAAPELDSKRLVFGKLLHGRDLLAKIEAQGVNLSRPHKTRGRFAGDEKTGEPKSSIVISSSAEVGESEIEAILAEEQKRRIQADA